MFEEAGPMNKEDIFAKSRQENAGKPEKNCSSFRRQEKNAVYDCKT